MREGVNKRGLSPVIASVLLILLVLVLASMIFLWARGFLGEQIEKFGEPIEESCRNIAFEAVKVDERGITKLEVLNKGDITIRALEIRMTRGGESVLEEFDFTIEAHKALTKSVDFIMPDGEEATSVIVYPVLIGNVAGEASSNNVFTCLNSGVTLY